MEPPANLTAWVGLLGALLAVGAATIAGVRWVVRVEVRAVLDREFANGKPPTAKEYQPLRASVDEIRSDIARLITLVASHTHDDIGNVLAPIVGREERA